MQIGIGIPNQVRDVDPTLVPTWAARAEQAGFASLATVGRIAYPGVMDTVALANAAGATSRIALLSGLLVAPAWPAELLAKELASIDGVSGARLTVGIGLGAWPDDFLSPGLGIHGRGSRLDSDIDTYRRVWSGMRVHDTSNALVPTATRQIPLLIGGFGPPAFRRAARSGAGYIAGSVPPAMVEPAFAAVRAEWAAHGRDGNPKLVAIAYAALGDPDAGRHNVHDYYASAGDEFATLISSNVATTAADLKQLVSGFAALGADELIVNPAVADPAELDRLADVLM